MSKAPAHDWMTSFSGRGRTLFVIAALATVVFAGCGASEAVSDAELAAVAAAEQAAVQEAATARLAEEAQRQAQLEQERADAAKLERQAEAERALAEREARLAEERRALEAEQERLALEKREEELAAREAELRERAREGELLAAAERERVHAEQQHRAEQEGLAAHAAEAAARQTELEARKPKLVEASLAVGAVLEVEMLEPLSSRTARAGEVFSTRVSRDITNDEGQVVIPIGSTIYGRVTDAKPLKKVGGRAALGVEFTDLELPDRERVAIYASYVELGKDKTRDKKKIGIAAAAGAVLGGIFGGDVGAAAAGAAVGAAAQTAVVATRKGEDVEFRPGQILAMRLDEVVTVETEMIGVAP
ncbi:MAG: hypothetical protein VYE73_12900 [Acidobacteriota bacterium]|nr:hypothetical protein [Acidobacteriota bacterium]